MATAHDFITDLADLIRPLIHFSGVTSRDVRGTEIIRFDSTERCGALWRFDSDEGFIFGGEPGVDSEPEQDDEWHDTQHALGAALHKAGKGIEWCGNSGQESGWAERRDLDE